MKIVRGIFIISIFLIISFPEMESEYIESQMEKTEKEIKILDKIGAPNGFLWKNIGCGYITKIIFNSNGSFTVTTILESMPNKKMINRGKWKQGDENTKVFARYSGESKQITFSFEDDFSLMTRNDNMIFNKETENIFK